MTFYRRKNLLAVLVGLFFIILGFYLIAGGVNAINNGNFAGGASIILGILFIGIGGYAIGS